ncbi:MAG: sel1 repeat family protein [Candidatus Omnitrophica bacterium]|nr:sel1 repeat family protein [Candidatus Omnitrophota bacterium]
MKTIINWRNLIVVLWIAFIPVNLFAESKIEKLKKTAETGNPKDQLTLAIAYDFGLGVKPNYNEAAKWYAKAADQGLADAQNALGSLYQSGEGVALDFKKAVELYQKAADQEDDQGITNLGYMYDLGLGVEQDDVKAVELYKRAADRGHLQAMVNLGMMYIQGQGVEQDYVEGYKWYELARFYTTTAQDMKLKWTIRSVLDPLRGSMAKEQIKEGKKRAVEWSKAHQVQKPRVSKYAPYNQN